MEKLLEEERAAKEGRELGVRGWTWAGRGKLGRKRRGGSIEAWDLVSLRPTLGQGSRCSEISTLQVLRILPHLEMGLRREVPRAWENGIRKG